MTRRTLSTSQPLLAAQAVLLAWTAMRIVFAQSSTLPDLPSVSVQWEKVARIKATQTPFALPQRLPPKQSVAMVVSRDVGRQSLHTLVKDSTPLVTDVVLPDPPIAPAIVAIRPGPAMIYVAPAQSPRLPVTVQTPGETLRGWKLRGSGWMLTRSGGGRTALASPGQLTGGQAGIRLYLSPGGSGATERLSLTTGLTSPLASASGREASLGLAWRPVRSVPMTVIAERRFGLNHRTPSRYMLLAAVGLPDQKLAGRWTLRSYAQAGVAGAKRRDGFADGSLDVTRSFGADGPLRVEAGIGGWGAVQPGVHRVDVGPRIDVVLSPLLRPMRFSLQWRERVAGNARPGSGPALVLGTDF